MDDDGDVIHTGIPDLTGVPLAEIAGSNDPELLAAIRRVVEQTVREDRESGC
jgi:FXSXX-COOH protein